MAALLLLFAHIGSKGDISGQNHSLAKTSWTLFSTFTNLISSFPLKQYNTKTFFQVMWPFSS